MNTASCISLLCTLSLQFLRIVSAQLTSFPLSSGNGFLAYSSPNGNVFVSSGNTLHRLTSDLQQLQDVSLPSTLIGLTTSTDGHWLVACLDTGLCTVYNTSNLNTISKAFIVDYSSNISTSIVLFTATLSGLQTLYAATGEVIPTGTRFELTQRGFAGSAIRRDFQSDSSSSVTRRFYGGFDHNNYSYFLALDTEGSSVTMYVMRVCNIDDGEVFRARYELQLTCGGVLPSNAVMSGVSAVGDTMVLSVAGRVCFYDLNNIDTILDNHFTLCLLMRSPIRQNIPQFGSSGICFYITISVSPISNNSMLCDFVPRSSFSKLVLNPTTASHTTTSVEGSNLLSSGALVSTASVVEGSVFVFIGTSTLVQKYLFTNISNPLYSILVSGAVTALSLSPGSDYVYVRTTTEVIRLPVEDCSSYYNCSSCVQNGDPLCGWCSVEKKCSRRAQCENNNETRRYLTQGEKNMCMNTVEFAPSKYVEGIHSLPFAVELSFSPASPPPALIGEQLLCIFSNEEIGISFNAILNSNECVLNSLPQLSDLKLVTNFSLYNSQSGLMFFTLKNAYTFYNCKHGTRCRDCVETAGNCGWCLYDFTCTGEALNCTVPDSFINSGDETIEYMCKFGSRSVTGQRLNSSRVLCNVAMNDLTLSTGTAHGQETRPFELQLRRGGKEYSLDTSTGGAINVTLYQCSALANGCSSCLAQRKGTHFQCGWCTSSSTCINDADTCYSSFNTVSGGCPYPRITGFFPNSGPTAGGTVVTITGTDLGVSYENIVKITVGSLNCTPIESSYVAGEEVSCELTSGSQQAGLANIIIMISTSGETRMALSTQQFRFAMPLISFVSPSFGPAAGGTMMKIRGEELDISNKEKTTVTLVMASERRRMVKRQSLPKCIVLTITFNELTCKWSSYRPSFPSIVEVTINNAVITDSSITYEYRNNPVYETINPQKTIISGGIKLYLTGKYLDVAQHPRLIFTDDNSVTVEAPCDATATTLVCVAPPITTLASYTIIMDGAPGPDNDINTLQVSLSEDPCFTSIANNMIDVGIDPEQTIIILGDHITNVQQSEVTVWVGSDKCNIQTIAIDFINCYPPLRMSAVNEPVMVTIGTNINITLQDTINYVGSEIPENGSVVGGAVGGVFLLILIFTVISTIITAIIVYSKKKMKERNEILINLQRELLSATRPIYTLPDQPIVMSYNVGYSPPHIYQYITGNEEQFRATTSSSNNSEDTQDDYYVNDDLAPFQSNDEVPTKEDADDYYVNDEKSDEMNLERGGYELLTTTKDEKTEVKNEMSEVGEVISEESSAVNGGHSKIYNMEQSYKETEL